MNEQDIFLEALERDDPLERRQFLQDVCATPDIRSRIEHLLQLHPESAEFMREPAVDVNLLAAFSETTTCDDLGQSIGRYKLLEQIGEGGMGVVYLAEQREPVNRRVALKVIKPGMDTKQVIARFESERQALALMEHANIARVLDAGETDAGRPYFVMDLVRGVPITNYCQREHVETLERLELFLAVCHAVQHAHLKGIIHRDIKPGNVMITLHDGVPVVKIIDFGVAKAMNQNLTDLTLFTNFNQMIGTPLYMSPEQAELSGLDVDTRSDIYSLGVLLYELLTDSTPFDEQRLKEIGFDEMRRVIREEDPPKPSTRISTLGAEPETISDKPSGRLERRRQLIQGELDWIVMRTMEKDRSRRYQSANDLADDVQRYLLNEPIEASPASHVYRIRKFISRHRMAALTTSAFMTLLIVALCTMAFLLVRAQNAESLATSRLHEQVDARQREAVAHQKAATALKAEAKHRQDAELARSAAEADRETAESVIKFLQDDFLGLISPSHESNPNVTLKTIVDEAAQKVEGRFAKQPLVEATLCYTFGGVYKELRELSKAEKYHQRAIELRTRELGDDDPLVLSGLEEVAWIKLMSRRPEQAADLFGQVYQVRCQTLGEDAPATLQSRARHIQALLEAHRFDLAEPLAEEALASSLRTEGDESMAAIHGMRRLARVYQELGKTDPLTELTQQADELAERLDLDGKTSPAEAQFAMAELMARLGQHDRATTFYERSFQLRRKAYGSGNPVTLVSLGSLAINQLNLGNHERAIDIFKEIVTAREERAGKESPAIINSLKNLAECYLAAGQVKSAEETGERLLGICQSNFGDKHASTLAAMLQLAKFKRVQRNFDDAEQLVRKVLETPKESLPKSLTLQTENALQRIAAARAASAATTNE